jgi:hypothetical protein
MVLPVESADQTCVGFLVGLLGSSVPFAKGIVSPHVRIWQVGISEFA